MPYNYFDEYSTSAPIYFDGYITSSSTNTTFYPIFAMNSADFVIVEKFRDKMKKLYFNKSTKEAGIVNFWRKLK